MGAEEVEENEGGRGGNGGRQPGGGRDSPSGPWHVGEAGEYEGLKHFC